MDEEIDLSDFDPERLRRELQSARVLFPERSVATPAATRPDWWDAPSQYSLQAVSSSINNKAISESDSLVHQYHHLVASDNNNNSGKTRRLESVFAPSIDWERAAHMLSDKLERANELAEHTQRENKLMAAQMMRLEQIIEARAVANAKKKHNECGSQTSLGMEQVDQMEHNLTEVIPQLARSQRALGGREAELQELQQSLQQANQHIEQNDRELCNLHQTVGQLQGLVRKQGDADQQLVDLHQAVEQLKLIVTEQEGQIKVGREALKSTNAELRDSQSRMITAEKTLKREKKRATRLQQKELAADLRDQRRQARPAGIGDDTGEVNGVEGAPLAGFGSG